jgi:hypothetical protein
LGFDCNMSYGEAAGANQPRIGKADDVRRFGEWLQSEKWFAMIDRGWAPRPAVVDRRRGGVAVKPREASVLKTVPEAEQQRWRRLRSQGASISAIARHVGRSNSVVDTVVCDIVPSAARSAEDLGLVPLPHFPKGKTEVDEPVATWRSRAQSGEATHVICRSFPDVSETAINNAVCDIRWEQLKTKRAQNEVRLERMKSAVQGHGRWRDVAGDET